MATWHPPIPAGKLYSEPALELGPALALLIWCYDGVQRNGVIEVSLDQAMREIGKPYRTIKDWWKALRSGPFFSELRDCGRKGWVARMADDWLDWHIMERNYPQFEGRNSALEENASKPGEGQDAALENAQGPLKARSRPDEGRNSALEGPAYKVLHDDQESKRESENHDNAVGSHSLKNGTGPKPKQRDPLALAIAAACRINPDYASKRQKESLNEAYLSLRDRGATPEDIPKRVDWWRREDWRAREEPGRPITPVELIEVWDMVAEPARPPPAPANGKPVDNRPPLPAFQPQTRTPTNGAKLRAILDEKRRTNGDTS